MIRSMGIGVTALKTFQEALSVSSNNIANSQTTGYKGQTASFEDLVYFQAKAGSAASDNFAGTNPNDLGSGVKLSSIKTNNERGSITNTGGKTDLAIDGNNGYFIVGNNDGTEKLYTRNGAFNYDKYLTTEGGYYVMGWTTNPETEELDTSSPVGKIEIPADQVIPGKETTEASVTGNVDFDMEIDESVKTQFAAYDQMGKRTDVTVELIRVSDTEFKYVATPDALKQTESIKNATLNVKDNYSSITAGDYNITVTPDATMGNLNVEIKDTSGSVIASKMVGNIDQLVSLKNAAGEDFITLNLEKAKTAGVQSTNLNIGDTGVMTFDSSGKVSSVTSDDASKTNPTVSYTSAATGLPINITLNMEELTLYASGSNLKTSDVDGKSASALKDFNITDDGIVVGTYDDGTVRQLGQVALAKFDNPLGLSRVGGNNYAATAASGEARVVSSGEAGVGRIKGSSLESSNVDLSTEFVNLIKFQRAFQGSSKIITVSDEVTSGVVNLIK